MGRFYLYIFAVPMLLWGAHAHAVDYFYVAREGDNLSTVLFRSLIRPVYGKNSALGELAKANKESIPDLNDILAGQKVRFPSALVEQAIRKNTVIVLETGEIRFMNAKQETRLPSNENLETSVSQAPPTIVETKVTSAAEGTNPANVGRVMDMIAATPVTCPHVEARPIVAPSVLAPETKSEPTPSAAEIAFETGYSRIESSQNSSSAVLLSRPSIAAHLKWQQNWTDGFQTFIRWKYESISFQDTTRGTANGAGQQTTSLFGLGLRQRLSDGLWSAFEIGTRDEIFLPSYAVGTATLETRPVAYAKVGLIQRLLETRSLMLTGSFAASYLSASSSSAFEVKPGRELSASLKVEQRFKSLSMFASGEYSDTAQNTSATTRSKVDIRSQLGFVFPLGEETQR